MDIAFTGKSLQSFRFLWHSFGGAIVGMLVWSVVDHGFKPKTKKL